MTTAETRNIDKFRDTLCAEYARLFQSNPDYAYSASKTTPEDLSRKMTLGLASGSASKDGEGIRNTCKALGIACTYKAIRAYFDLDYAKAGAQ